MVLEIYYLLLAGSRVIEQSYP